MVGVARRLSCTKDTNALFAMLLLLLKVSVLSRSLLSLNISRILKNFVVTTS